MTAQDSTFTTDALHAIGRCHTAWSWCDTAWSGWISRFCEGEGDEETQEREEPSHTNLLQTGEEYSGKDGKVPLK